MLIKNIHPLSEGDFTIGFDKKFVPFDEDVDRLEDRSPGSLLVEIQPFLIETDEDLILLDTGLGFAGQHGPSRQHELIEEKGYRIEEVSKVLISHLHKDHAGGMLIEGRPSYPQAKYYIHASEWNYAVSQDGKSYEKDLFESLEKTDQIEWLTESSAYIDEDISYEHSGGHSPEHIVFLIEGENQTLFFGGDEAPQAKQMKTKYIAKYDFDGRKALELREQYMERGLEGDWIFLFYHDTRSPAVNFSRQI